MALALVENDPVFARQDGVKVYKDADILTEYKDIKYKRDDPYFLADELIGKFTGQILVSGGQEFISVKWIHKYVIYDAFRWLIRKNKLDDKGNGEEILDGWVLSNQVSNTTTSGDANEAAAKLKKEMDDPTSPAAGASTDTTGAGSGALGGILSNQYFLIIALAIPIFIMIFQSMMFRRRE